MSIVNKALEKLKESRAQEGARPLTDDSRDRTGTNARRAYLESAFADSIAEDVPTRVVVIDRGAMHRAGVIPSEADRATSAEQYRAIKQDLIRYFTAPSEYVGAPRQCIMVTSALPGDGKTYTSVNLALSMTSERDHDVLLLDGDLAMRHLTRTLGMADEPGLLDVLRDSSRSLSSVLYRTDVSRLHFLPAGKWSEDAAELLASERMGQLTVEIQKRHPRRIVVMDSSPVLLTPDSRVLAMQAGQIVLVVKAGVTLQHDAKETASLLAGDGRRLTLVLNQVRTHDLLSSLVGYRYGYGYGSRRPSDEQSAVPNS